MTFLPNEADARDVYHVVEGVQEGENRSVASLSCECRDEMCVRCRFIEFRTIDHQSFSVYDVSYVQLEKVEQQTCQCHG